MVIYYCRPLITLAADFVSKVASTPRSITHYVKCGNDVLDSIDVRTLGLEQLAAALVLEKLSSELDLEDKTDGLRLTEDISSAEE